MNIQELAEQVGGVFDVLALGRHDGVLFTRTELEELVALVAAHEREECANIARGVADATEPDDWALDKCNEIEQAIRARSKA